MQKKLTAALAAALLGLGTLLGMPLAHASAHSEEEAITVTGIAEVYGDGEKIAAARIVYPKEIDARSVTADDFQVSGKTIASVHVSDEPSLTKETAAGTYIFLKFANTNTVYDGDLAKKNWRETAEHKSQGTDAPRRSNRKPPDLSLEVYQRGIVKAVDGTIYAPHTQSLAVTLLEEPILDAFRQEIYKDGKTGLSMPYNIYLPADYDPAKRYPLLFFVADASANINDVKTPLF